ELYAVGILFYQILTNHHPFEPFDHKFFDRVISVEPDWSKIDQSLRPLCKQLLAKDPCKRISSAIDALRMLAATQGDDHTTESKAIRESYLQAAKFVGRDMEIAKLNMALSEAIGGQGSGWLIAGESGVGKSRLLDEISTLALVDGFLVLRGQAQEVAGGATYQLWREPLRRALLAISEIDDLSAGVLQSLVPDISDLLQREVPPAPPLKGKAAQLRLLTTIASVFYAVEQPILLILEDLHWTKESILPLPYLLDGISSQRLLIVASYRNDEMPDLPSRLPSMQLLSLDRFNEETISQLSQAMLGTNGEREEIVDLLIKETEGNAFFAVEVIRALAEASGHLDSVSENANPSRLIPHGIQEIVERRLARLPQEAQALLSLAALVGRTIDLPLMACLSGRDNLETWWLPHCADAAVLNFERGEWQFNHAKIQAGLLSGLDPVQLTADHGRIAAGLESIYVDRPELAARLAYHWQHAGQLDKEISYSMKAGRYAADQFANDDAIDHFSHALAKTAPNEAQTRFEILLARELVYDHSAANRAEQQEDLTELASLATILDDPAKHANVFLRQAELYTRTGQPQKAISAAERALKESERAGDEELILESHAAIGFAYGMLNKHEKGVAHLEQSVEGHRKRGDQRNLGYALNSLSILYSYMGRYDDEKKCLKESLAIAQSLGETRLISRLYNNLSMTYSHQGDFQASQFYLEKGLHLYTEMGDLLGQGIAQINSGIDYYNIGDYQTALRYVKSSLAIFRQVHDLHGENLSTFFLSLIAERIKNHQEAKQIIEASIDVAITSNSENSLGERFTHLGFIYKQQQDYSQANDLFEKAKLLLNSEENQEEIATVYYLQAQIAREQESWEAAIDLYQKAYRLIEHKTHVPLWIPTQTGTAEAYLAQDDLSAASTYIEPIVDHLLNKPLVDGWHGMRSAAQAYTVLEALGDQRADDVLKRAYDRLLSLNKLITSRADQRFALEEVPEHQKIVALFAEAQQSKLTHKVTYMEEEADKTLNTDAVVTSIIDDLLNTGSPSDPSLKEAPKENRLRGEPLLSHLLSVSRSMAEMRSVDPLLSYAIDAVMPLVGAERGYIVLINPNGSLDYRVRRRIDGREISSKVDAISRSVLDEVIKSEQSIVIRNATMDPRFGGSMSVMALQ
ncbi:MAG: tetratricopeptide repeat protein, partial [Chloroflexota bacterium]